jgi:Ca2+-binding EF-hand superfamily protein
MTKKQVFEFIDINKNGTLDKEELVDGLKKLGFNVVFVGRVVAVFDRDSSGDVAMDEWLHILG